MSGTKPKQVEPGATFEMVVGSGTKRSRAVQAMLAAGALNGIQLMETFGKATRVQLIHRIKEEGLYKEFFPRWEDFCVEYLGAARRTVDEDLTFLERLGADFLEAADTLGLGRRQLRALAAAPPELLPHAEGDELVIGDERINLSEKGRVVELLEELVAQQDRLQTHLKKGEEQLQEAQTEKAELKAELKRRDDVASGRLATEFDEAMLLSIQHLRRAADLVDDPDPARRPTPKGAQAYLQAIQPILTELTHYAGQYVTPAWAQDEESLRRHMEQQARAGGAEMEGDDDEDELL